MAKKSKNKTPKRAATRSAFVRGFVATGLVVAVEGGLTCDSMSRALKGGIAVAIGTLVADSIERNAPAQGALALACGVICLAAVNGGTSDKETKEVETHG